MQKRDKRLVAETPESLKRARKTYGEEMATFRCVVSVSLVLACTT